jgi:hypothetical protein
LEVRKLGRSTGMRILPPRWIRLLKVVGVAFLLLALVLPASLQARHKRYKSWTTRIGSGVHFTAIRDPRGPYRIRIISVRLSQSSTIDVALAHDRLQGEPLETTSSMARRHGAVAAVNGDYSLGLGRPAHPFAEDGHIVQWSPFWQNHNFAVDHSEKRAFIAPAQFSVWMQERDSRIFHDIRFANAGPPGGQGLSLYTPVGGSMEKPPSRACSARLYSLERPRLASDGAVIAEHRVDVVRCARTPLTRRGGKVLVARRGGSRAHEIRRLRSGDLVTLGWSPGWPGVYETLGAWPILVNRGRIAWKFVRGSTLFYSRHPRTGVGYDRDSGKVFLVTVDGRRRGSVGMTPLKFARFFKSLGVEWALNLDGGGSTTSVVRGEVQNRPSDGRERPVSSALLVLPGVDRGELTGNLELVSAQASHAAEVGLSPTAFLQRIARDPASTGGMASALLERGIHLPPALRWSAHELERSTRR